MKKLVTLVFCAAFLGTQAQTITSTANGTWLNPLTWDCSCVPGTTSVVVVAHDVSLDLDWTVGSGGSITINSGASLTGSTPSRLMSLSGGDLFNSGTFTVFGFSTSPGTFKNMGTANINALWNVDTTLNTGAIVGDSLLNDGEFTNDPGSVIDMTDLLNDSTMYNSGTVNAFDMTNLGNFFNDPGAAVNIGQDITSCGYFCNKGSLDIVTDFYNCGAFDNLGSSSITIGVDGLNADTTGAKVAVMTNNSFIEVGHDWLNKDTLKGSAPGQFCIQNWTGNEGVMQGTFDFCDKTPTAGPPYVDWTPGGSIAPSITWCAGPPCTVGEDEASVNMIRTYPNPVSGIHTIALSSSATGRVQVFTPGGAMCLSQALTNGINRIDMSRLSPGIYICVVSSDGKAKRYKLSLMR